MTEESRFSVGTNGELTYYPRVGEIDPRKVSSGYEDWFEVTCDTQDYKPEEIEIKVKLNLIHVSGKSETKCFYREFVLDEGVSADNLICSIWNAAGVLIISAPIRKGPQKITPPKPNMPITMEPFKDCHQKAKTASALAASSKKPADWMTVMPASELQKLSLQENNDGITIPWSVEEDDSEDIPSIANDPRFEDVTDYLCLVDDKHGIETFELNFEMHEYLPEDIVIRIAKRIVVIMAKHESKKGNRTSRLKMFKKFTIPEGAVRENVHCFLQEEILRVLVTRTKAVHQRKTLATSVDTAAIEDVLKKRKDKVCNPAGQIVEK